MGRLQLELSNASLHCHQGAEQTLDPRHTLPLGVKAELGECLIQLGEYEQAERLLLECYTLFRNSLGEQHPKTQRVLDDVVELYTCWNQPDKLRHYSAL